MYVYVIRRVIYIQYVIYFCVRTLSKKKEKPNGNIKNSAFLVTLPNSNAATFYTSVFSIFIIDRKFSLSVWVKLLVRSVLLQHEKR